MKTKIIKVTYFVVILLVVLIILSQIAIPKNNLKDFGMQDVLANGILGEKDNTIDILVVGDSEAYTSIIPMEIWKDYGFTSYVCATSGQILPDSLMFTYKAMKKQSPKIVILEADNIYRRADLSIPFEKILNIILPITEYHDRWKNINNNDFFKKADYTWTDDMKGYWYSDLINASDSSNYMTASDKSNIIPKSNKIYIKLLKKYCEYNNAQLLIVSTPSTINWNYENHNAVKEFLDNENIEFLDLNVLKDEININWEKDTRDKGDHLNHFGALKVTKYLGKYLNDKNILKDHRKENDYKRWNEALERYEKKVN